MAKPTEQSGESFMLKLARFIVDKRNLVFLVVIIGLIFSVFSRSWVQVENDLTAYLRRFRDPPGARRHGRAIHHLRHSERDGCQSPARRRLRSTGEAGGCRGRAGRGVRRDRRALQQRQRALLRPLAAVSLRSATYCLCLSFSNSSLMGNFSFLIMGKTKATNFLRLIAFGLVIILLVSFLAHLCFLHNVFQLLSTMFRTNTMFLILVHHN